MEDVVEYYTEHMLSEIRVVKVLKSKPKQNNILRKNRTDLSQADQESLSIHQLEATASNVVLHMSEYW